jgi:hypothetical protein
VGEDIVGSLPHEAHDKANRDQRRNCVPGESLNRVEKENPALEMSSARAGTRHSQNGLEIDVEVHDICHLEADTIHQHDVATDYDMGVIRRRRREHHFQFSWARLHSPPKAWRQRSVDYKLPFEPGRKTVALGQAGRQVRVVGPVPITSRIAIMIGITVVILIVALAVTVAMVVVIVAIMFVVAMTVSLGHCRNRRESE